MEDALRRSNLPGRASESSYFPGIVQATRDWIEFERSAAKLATKNGLVEEIGNGHRFYYKFEVPIGYSNGKETKWIKIELTSGTMHSYPISEKELPNGFSGLG